jgi:IclR family acetate operon transcriptional repressor
VLTFISEKGLPQYTENSITDMDTFIEEINETRRLGYSVDMEGYLKGIRAIATLIRQDGKPIGAIKPNYPQSETHGRSNKRKDVF